MKLHSGKNADTEARFVPAEAAFVVRSETLEASVDPAADRLVARAEAAPPIVPEAVVIPRFIEDEACAIFPDKVVRLSLKITV